MSLRDYISSSISNNVIGANCDNCYNKEYCPSEQYKATKESGGACVDWAMSDDLAEDITDDIIDFICKNLGVR